MNKVTTNNYIKKKPHLVVETGEEVRINEAWSDALVGAGTWLMPEELAKTVQNTIANEYAPLYLWIDWKEPKKGLVRVGRSQEPWTRGLLLTCQKSYLDNRDLLSHFHPKPDALERLVASECHLSFPSFLNYLCSWEFYAEEFSPTNWQQAWWQRKYWMPFVMETRIILPSSSDTLVSTYIGYWITEENSSPMYRTGLPHRIQDCRYKKTVAPCIELWIDT